MRKGIAGFVLLGALVALGGITSGQASSQVWQNNAIRAIAAADAGHRPQGHFLPSGTVQAAVRTASAATGAAPAPVPPSSVGCPNVMKAAHRSANVRAGRSCDLDRQADLSLAIDPTNPKDIVIGQADGQGGLSRPQIDYSLDGGRHWATYEMPSSGNQTSTGDRWTFDAFGGPSVAWGPDGALYAAAIGFDVLHDGYDQVFVLKSNPGYRGSFLHSPDAADLGGAQALSATPVGLVNDNFADPTRFDDHVSVVVDRFASSPLKGTAYAVWTMFDYSCGKTGDAYCSSAIFFSKSTDGGTTWNGGTVNQPGPPVEISGQSAALCRFGDLFDKNRDPSSCDFDQGAAPVVAPDGSIGVAFENCNATLEGATGPGACQQLFVRSRDGGATWSAPVKVGDDIATQPVQGLSGLLPNGCPQFRACLPPNGYAVNDFPSAGVDEETGTLAVFWSDFRNGSFATDKSGNLSCSPCNADVFAATSSDGGTTWSQTSQVDTSTSAQFLPHGDVGPRGNLVVAYYDRSYGDGERSGSLGLTLAVSRDGGATWRHREVTAGEMPNLTPDTNGFQAGFIGDRIGLVARGSHVDVAWVDTRGLGGAIDEDAYFARVSPDLMERKLTGRLLVEAATSMRRRRLAGAILRTAGPVLPTTPPPDRAVFILGSPRSGTTLLFEVLGASPHLASLGVESHLLWEMFHSLDGSGFGSHELGPEDITDRERRVLHWAVDRISVGRRYLDKAPRNCLRVPYLAALFPGAFFVHLKRDGRAAVSSLITGWRSGAEMFAGTRMPRPLRIEGYEGETWKFLVPPGWEVFATGHSLEEVCAFQWIAANESIMAARDGIPSSRWVELSYEKFTRNPGEEIKGLLRRLEVPLDQAVLERAAGLQNLVTKAVTAPKPDKWRTENPREIERILPMIEPTMRKLGYEVGDQAS